MKILLIDKYYFIKGGAERYYFELKKILETMGHTVIPFSMKHERNFSTEYEEYFVDNIEFNLNSKFKKALNGPKITGRIIYSLHAQKMIEKLIEKTKPDIAHLHMIDHQISPSILPVLKRYGIPIIQTVHQYKLVCPNYRLYIPQKNEICERCLNGNFFNAIFQRCHKNSLFASTLVSFESYIHRWLKIYDNIDLFHTPSKFMKEKLIESGINKSKVRSLFYTINISEYPFHPKFKNYFIYFGRLSAEKGVNTLLKAVKKINSNLTNVYIVGDGPDEIKLQEYVLKNNLEQVKFFGLKSGDDLKSIVANAMFVIVPSEWYDNSPLVIYEAFSLGKPVIGSNLGGITELIDDQKNGLLFKAKSVDDLSEKMEYLLTKPSKIIEFGRNARVKAEKCFVPNKHYQNIVSFYKSLLNH